MKLLLKVHKLGKPTSHNNLTKLTGRPIITAHSWITSNPSCLDLLGIELDRIILQLKNLFKEWNIPYPLIYNSYDLLLLLDKLHITNNCTTCVSQRLTSHPFTPTYHTMTLLEPSSWAENCLICQTFIGTIYLTSIKTNSFIAGDTWPITYQGVAMDSYHSRQIVGLVLSLSEFSLFNNTNCPTK